MWRDDLFLSCVQFVTLKWCMLGLRTPLLLYHQPFSICVEQTFIVRGKGGGTLTLCIQDYVKVKGSEMDDMTKSRTPAAQWKSQFNGEMELSAGPIV